ncbi:hypothetical protein BaRGS_00005106 [Batillaria attramentaria]|uniref:Uncharacterized protein n=1 Tax=Batillaria attramentaria TaxID=370345 RepID=A0ABD0LVL9_9CAEN
MSERNTKFKWPGFASLVSPKRTSIGGRSDGQVCSVETRCSKEKGSRDELAIFSIESPPPLFSWGARQIFGL